MALPLAAVSISPRGLLYLGETVTLQCDISDYTDWTYLWSRDNQQLSSQTSETITISLPDQAGQYQCQGKRTRQPQWSNLSSSLPIIVTTLPETTLTVEPKPVFSGERVTLMCSVGSDSSWSYKWYKDRNDNKPQPVLGISPQWLNPGDSVALNCKVDKTSTGRRFSWYRTVPYRAGLPSLSDKSYSLQPLSDNVNSEDSYTQIPAGPTPTGGYVCRVGRGDPVYDTLQSEAFSVSQKKPTQQHFRSKSLSLSCEKKGNSTGWRLRYTERGVESGCVSNWRSITGSTCTIRSTYTGDSGVYWCESGSGEYSNAVNITDLDRSARE
ncbi:leukocyte immunoglobulin-like receptor subfamily B member 5 [Oncorhynchus tshawytscha]|uniref:leukocyte immunoglobulin-like receptor subfamily B member 5 n=1 Tax=Oncorhynchus tshawytscha TaxID=74940 RepID=UPI001C3D8A49|nr:leukocyte immunoglobulin-like receptor subfamily B member 5 [Oncorhynchus tshawytscha]